MSWLTAGSAPAGGSATRNRRKNRSAVVAPPLSSIGARSTLFRRGGRDVGQSLGEDAALTRPLHLASANDRFGRRTTAPVRCLNRRPHGGRSNLRLATGRKRPVRLRTPRRDSAPRPFAPGACVHSASIVVGSHSPDRSNLRA